MTCWLLLVPAPWARCMVQVAALKTPKKLVVIGMVDERLELAKQYSADVVINPSG